MTTAVKEKKPFLPQRKPQVPAAGAAVTLRAGAGAAPRGVANLTPLAIGGDPRVHLLPLEVTQRKKVKRLKRRLLFAGAVVVAIAAVGYGLASFELSTAQGQLNAAQATTSQLLAQQAKYGEVTKINSDAAAILQAQKTTTTQEILWAPYLSDIEATLPATATVTAVSAQLDTPFGSPAASTATTTVPLQGPRIATLNLTVAMLQADIPTWLTTLPTLKGFVDATPDSVTATTGGYYTVVVTLHINDKAVSGRFAKAAGTNK
jgi:Tfp pilus assembly protein PilN